MDIKIVDYPDVINICDYTKFEAIYRELRAISMKYKIAIVINGKIFNYGESYD